MIDNTIRGISRPVNTLDLRVQGNLIWIRTPLPCHSEERTNAGFLPLASLRPKQAPVDDSRKQR